MFHCVCFNINIDHTIQVDRTPDSKTAWWKASDDQNITVQTFVTR